MRKPSIGIATGALLGLVLGWWHGFAGWPTWAALIFMAALGALIGYRVVSSDRRDLVWLLLWVLPGALIGFVAGVIAQAEPLDKLHLALEYAIYASIIGLLGPGNGKTGLPVGGLLVGALGLAASLLGEVPEKLITGSVQLSNPTRVQVAFLSTLQALVMGGILGGLLEFAIRSWRGHK